MELKISLLEKNKKDIIINSAITEFSHHTFKNSSTDRVAQNSGISKGSLFNYFGNKKNIYLYVLDFCTENLLTEYKKVERYVTGESDFMNRIIFLAYFKFNVLKSYPSIFDFIFKAASEKEEFIASHVGKTIEKIKTEYMPDLYKNIDNNLFREDIDITQLLKMLNWIIDGYSNEQMQLLRSNQIKHDELTEKFKEDMSKMTNVLKILFYK